MQITMEIKEITQLIDNYGSLLSQCKRKYIENYYFHNASLRDIADLYHVSRAAVHEAIKEALSELHAYEANLHFISTQNKRLKFYQQKITDKQLLQELIDLELGVKPKC